MNYILKLKNEIESVGTEKKIRMAATANVHYTTLYLCGYTHIAGNVFPFIEPVTIANKQKKKKNRKYSYIRIRVYDTHAYIKRKKNAVV